MSHETAERNGLPGPTLGAPPRAPGSVRRTSSFDLSRPDGPDGRLEVLGRARDLLTDDDGTTRVMATGMASGTVVDGVVTRLSTHPHTRGTPGLVGRKASVGWRTGVWRGLRDHYDSGTPLHLLLDELPVGLIIAGYTYRRSKRDSEPHSGRRPDVCAGWAADSRAMRVFTATGSPPGAVTPPNEPLAAADDPVGWHTLPALPVWGISRRRRLDVGPATSGDGWAFQAMFRDVYRDDNPNTPNEFVLHEYWVAGEVGADGLIRRIEASPKVLPHLECPTSAASAPALVGVPVARLRERVSMELFGPQTCTHLNDLLRFVTDVCALSGYLARADV